MTVLENEANALRQSEEKYRLLVENSLQGLAIIQNFRFVFCNPRFAEMSGYTVPELLALSQNEIGSMVHPEDRMTLWQRYQDRLEGKPVSPCYEYRAIKKDGSQIWLEMYASPIQYNGSPAVQSVFMDVTERKTAAENLQRALEWQKAIFEGSRDAIMISDEASGIIDVNEAACRLTGYSRQELLRMRVQDLNKNCDFSVLDDLLQRILAGEDILGETEIVTKEGRKVDVEFSHQIVHVAGKPYIHSVARDITRRKRLEDQFLQAQKMEAVGLLAGGVAHDLNNMLNVINGYGELLLEDLAPDDPMRPDLEMIKKAGQNSASLVSQLLAFSRKQILQPEILNLNDSIEEMGKMLRRLIGENIQLTTVTQPDLGLISADPGQIQQIIINLAVNARDAMPRGGKLTLETANVDFKESYFSSHPVNAAGPHVMLAISDTGIGMDPATQSHIFEPFFTTKGQGKGTGLGLSAVYGIVKQSRGFIWVYSEEGIGTTFKIYFPRATAKTNESEKEANPGSRYAGSATVLLVEDEESVRSLGSRILRERGYSVLEAANGEDALFIAGQHAGGITLVLTDVVMPGMSGPDLVSKIKSLRPGIKSLFVSGYADEAIVHHGILQSNINFLQKPFTIESLTRKVVEVLNMGPDAVN